MPTSRENPTLVGREARVNTLAIRLETTERVEGVNPVPSAERATRSGRSPSSGFRACQRRVRPR
jgi:hypothetical protein